MGENYRISKLVEMIGLRTPIQALRAVVAAHQTQQAAARSLRISNTQLSELLRGKRSFSDALLKRLGLERVIVARKSA